MDKDIVNAVLKPVTEEWYRGPAYWDRPKLALELCEVIQLMRELGVTTPLDWPFLYLMAIPEWRKMKQEAHA